jgi:hypothetical protein
MEINEEGRSMNWQDCQILNFHTDPDFGKSLDGKPDTGNSQLLLEWIADNPFFKSDVFEDEIEIPNQKFYRFAISSTDSSGNEYQGIGRSKNRLEAASIAAGEVIERYAAKKVLKSQIPLFAKHIVQVSESTISVSPADSDSALPSSGLHSSNGWAVHFSVKAAVEKAVLESLERHTLLFSYLHSGWEGFCADSPVPFKGQNLIPYVSRFSFGGFSAGIVITTGEKFPGQTFGYLCDDADDIYGSPKWMSAFFESFGQWEALPTQDTNPIDSNFLTKYQRHFLNSTPSCLPTNSQLGKIEPVSDIKANILVLDLQMALSLPVPMFAAFCFGGNLIPLFFKQKLSADEMVSLKKVFKGWALSTDLPEVHPIL